MNVFTFEPGSRPTTRGGAHYSVTFSNIVLVLDHGIFLNCRIYNCTVCWNGGPVHLDTCHFGMCVFLVHGCEVADGSEFQALLLQSRSSSPDAGERPW